MIPAFVINLERDTGRRAHMEASLAAVGLEAEFVPAVYGRALAVAERAAAYDGARALRVYGVEMMDSEIGCCLSHLRLYERILRDGIPVALILEDDVGIEPALPRVVADVMAAAYHGWDVVRLDCKRTQVVAGTRAKFRGRRVAALSDGAGLYRLRTRVLGTGAYLIRAEGARKMLAYVRAGAFMPIDQMMDRYWENGIAPFVVRPFPVRQGDAFGTHSAGRDDADRKRGQPVALRLRQRAQRIEDGVRKRAYALVR